MSAAAIYSDDIEEVRAFEEYAGVDAEAAVFIQANVGAISLGAMADALGMRKEKISEAIKRMGLKPAKAKLMEIEGVDFLPIDAQRIFTGRGIITRMPCDPKKTGLVSRTFYTQWDVEDELPYSDESARDRRIQRTKPQAQEACNAR